MSATTKTRALSTCKLLVALILSASFTSALAADEMKEFGWKGNGGGNLEVYGINHDQVDRRGDFFFVYGGAPSTGDVRYIHFDGAHWSTMVAIDHGGNMDVRGRLRASEIIVEEPSGWPDYVFSEGYKLKSLSEIEKFIKTNQRLPGFPSAAYIQANGHNVAEVNRQLLRHTEELTLHTIKLQQRNEELETRLEKLETLVLHKAN